MRLNAKNNESIRDFENWVKGELYGPRKEAERDNQMGDMTTISTCNKCGLHYRESLIPHQCAEWTKGRKEAKETQPMSDTLQEREDQMSETVVNDKQVNKIVDAVYRSMAQYEDGTWFLDNLKAKARVRYLLQHPVGDPDSDGALSWCDDCHGYTHMPYCPSYESDKEVTSQAATTPHQPAARGDWRECDTCRAKPGSPVLCSGCLHNRTLYQSLVAERESLRESLRQAREFICEATWGKGARARDAERMVLQIDVSLNPITDSDQKGPSE